MEKVRVLVYLTSSALTVKREGDTKEVIIDFKDPPLNNKILPYIFIDHDTKILGWKDEKARNWEIIPSLDSKTFLNQLRQQLLKTIPKDWDASETDTHEFEAVKKFIRTFQRATDRYEDVYRNHKRFVDNISDDFRVIPARYIYRGLSVPKEIIDKLSQGKTISLKPRLLTSWTTDLARAKKFAGGSGSSNAIVIQVKTPPKNKIILSFVAPILKGCCDEEEEILCRGNVIDKINRKNIVYPSL